mgnify:CR=1 FL=1
MLTRETVIDKIEVLELGHVQVRRATYIEEDGVRVSGPEYHRVAYEPGATITAEHARVKAVAQAIWTPAVIAAHRARVNPLAQET